MRMHTFPLTEQRFVPDVSTIRGGRVPADVSKRGVDDGNQKGGGSTQPAKKSHF